MSLVFRILGRVAVGLIVVVALAALPSNAGAARPFTTGVTVPDTSPVPQLGYDRIASAGGEMTRVIIYWSTVAPLEEPTSWNPANPDDPNYNWDAYDDQISKAAAAGLTTLVQIYLAPTWAERCEAPGEPGICNPDPVDFQKFTTAAVERYSGNHPGLPRVRFWEPWNEPNLHLFMKPQRVGSKRPSPGNYRVLLNRFADSVKKSNAGNQVVAGGLAPLGGENSTHPLDFMRRLFCMEGRSKPIPVRSCNVKVRFDYWATNPYTTGGPTHAAIHPDDVQMGDLPEVVKLIKAAKKAGRIVTNRKAIPLWVTEFSYDSAPPDPGGLKMGILNRWTAEAMYRSWKAGFDTFMWLSLRDWYRAGDLPYSQTFESGLWFRGDTIGRDRPKAVLRVFKAPFVAFRSRKGILIWGKALNGKPGSVAIRFGSKANRVRRRIATVRADRYGVFHRFIRTKVGRNKRGFVTATSGGFVSVPFSLKPQRDFYHPPFGKP